MRRRVAACTATALAVVAATLPARVSPAPAAPAPVALSIGVVGDSITAPCGTTDGGWCRELKALLAANGVTATFHVAAISGATCGGVIDATRRMLAARPQVVVIMCGTNNDTSAPASRDRLGWEWRTLVEASHAAGAKVVPTFIQYSDVEINAAAGRSWLVPSEARANDVIYTNLWYYWPAGWFAGLVDLQVIPGNRTYLAGGSDGIHPNRLGQRVIAVRVYRAIRGHFGLPDTVAEPCDMWGHRPGYPAPGYTPCTSTA